MCASNCSGGCPECAPDDHCDFYDRDLCIPKLRNRSCPCDRFTGGNNHEFGREA